MTWIVGKTEATEAEWQLDGSAVITGTATVRYWRQNGATKEFLQADQSAFGATDVAHSLTLSGTKWRRTLVIPSSMDGFTTHEEVRHSDTDLPAMVESHYVTVFDTDSAEANRAAEATTNQAEHDATQAKIDQIISATSQPTGRMGAGGTATG